MISLIPKDHKVTVNCSNKEKGAPVVKNCKTSCVGCKLCEKACETGAMKVINNVAFVDYSLCDGCGKCIAACKRGVLR